MAVGQQVVSVSADVAALDALADRLTVLELSRGAAHVELLRTVLQLEAVGRSSGLQLATVAHAALALGCSEDRAARLLGEALLLGELPGGLEAVECGLLTVEQSSTVAELLAPLPLLVRSSVWQRLQARLVGRDEALPPARLNELLRRWVLEVDPADAVERRRQGEEGRRVDYRRHVDGLGDLFALGFTGPDLQAVLSRIRDRSRPVGPDDDRTADQRRFDTVRDMLLGRDALPLTDALEPCTGHSGGHGGGRAACGCWPGSPVPCGAEMLVHVTLDATLGRSDQPAELVGHGPLQADLLQDLLLAAPRLRPVWTDVDGVPVAVGDQVLTPTRDDPASVRQALLRLASLPPPDVLHPRHPHDHAADPPPDSALAVDARTPTAEASPVSEVIAGPVAAAPAAAQGTGAHPAGTCGGYRPSRRLRRLIEVRSPRCEWPGCGARATRCDAEHDRAWPAGATCACNLGPCCRRHHRIKQHGWIKTRTAGGVTWTSPGRGRSWLSPTQHQPPAPVVRPLPPVERDDGLTPWEREQQDWLHAGRPDDPDSLELRAEEPTEPEPRDVLGDHLRHHETNWTLDLDDPHLWAS